jgi:hypothetical protein
MIFFQGIADGWLAAVYLLGYIFGFGWFAMLIYFLCKKVKSWTAYWVADWEKYKKENGLS